MYVHTLPKYVYVCIRLSHLLSLSLQFNGACLHAIDARLSSVSVLFRLSSVASSSSLGCTVQTQGQRSSEMAQFVSMQSFVYQQ